MNRVRGTCITCELRSVLCVKKILLLAVHTCSYLHSFFASSMKLTLHTHHWLLLRATPPVDYIKLRSIALLSAYGKNRLDKFMTACLSAFIVSREGPSRAKNVISSFPLLTFKLLILWYEVQELYALFVLLETWAIAVEEYIFYNSYDDDDDASDKSIIKKDKVNGGSQFRRTLFFLKSYSFSSSLLLPYFKFYQKPWVTRRSHSWERRCYTLRPTTIEDMENSKCDTRALSQPNR